VYVVYVVQVLYAERCRTVDETENQTLQRATSKQSSKQSSNVVLWVGVVEVV
jgi:hypothetical protein